MKFFIDTANIKEIEEAARLGILDGVTTNPTLLAKEKEQPEELFRQICNIVDGPVNAETIALDWQGIVEEGKKLAEIAENIVIKIPMSKDGLKAVNVFAKEGIRTNVTLIFSPVQALLAARAGATFVCPFVGRLDDIQTPGMDVIAKIKEMFDNYGIESEIIVASIRDTLHVVDAALIGADIATIPFKVIGQLLKHPLTDIGIERFLADWDKVKNR
ncbi:MAG: fructose-6-phosphate aldolase [Caldithrix sp.]|nr:fructose-6-phosphate aldolase [Caldithrix sp.]